MTKWPAEPFFTLHRDLPREGPGEGDDIRWAAEVAGLAKGANVADVGCGPGGDIGDLLSVAPEGHVTALDKVPHFVDAARSQWHDDPRVTVLRADMASIANTYDMIWCAGAAYFLGVTEALRTWRKALRPGGVVAFSQVCWFTAERSDASQAYWAKEYPDLTDEAGVLDQISAAGYDVLATRRLSDAAWEAYYGPLEARIAALRPDANPDLAAVLEDAEQEIVCWRTHRQEFGYLLSVVRPA